MTRHRESPVRRVNPSGKVVWVARYTAPDGSHPSAGTFPTKREAQQAIDDAYGQPVTSPEAVGTYAATWTTRHPRSQRTNATNDYRVRCVLDVLVEGVPFRDIPMRDLKRRHIYVLVDVMLRDQGRSVSGVRNVLRTLSAMFENAIDDECCELNPVTGVKVRDNDPRCTKAPRAVRVWTFHQMHAFAAAASRVTKQNYVEGAKVEDTELTKWRRAHAEPMLRVLTDCNVRLGELLALHRADLCAICPECDGPHLHVWRNAHEGTITAGDTSTKKHTRIVPLAPSTWSVVKAMPVRIDSALLFPTPSGKVWRESLFYRDLWKPTQEATGMDIRPHECRHSYVTLMRAAIGENHTADLAAIAGHSVETMSANYSHSTGQTFDKVRAVIG